VKSFIKFSLLLACAGWCLTSEARQVDIQFLGNTQAEVFFDAPLDDQQLQGPSLNQEADQAHFCEKIIIENEGDSPLKGLHAFVNGKDFYSKEGLSRYIEQQNRHPLLTLYLLWKDSFIQKETSNLTFPTPLHFLYFANSLNKKQHAESFCKLCNLLFFSTRLANTYGTACYDVQLQDKWILLDPTLQHFYLDLDNQTLVSSEEILDDPFLALRAQSLVCSTLEQRAANLARFEIVQQRLAKENEPFLAEDIKIETDLYPTEKLVYLCHAIKRGTSVIQHLVNPQERGFSFSYHSLFPIAVIYNETTEPVFLKSFNTTIYPNESYTIHNLCVMDLEIESSQTASGFLLVEGSGNKRLFPLLDKGLNTVDLGASSNPSSIIMHYEFNPDLEETEFCHLKVEETPAFFDHMTPAFSLSADSQPDKIWWQISIHSNFDFVPGALEGVESYTGKVTLDQLAETFLNPKKTYYFRVKGYANGHWGDWSEPFAFSLEKPNQVQSIKFEKIYEREGKYEVTWQDAEDSEVEYLVFGSNSLDFIPSIYINRQINALVNEEAVEEETQDNLLTIVSEPRVEVDGLPAYLRIIARKRGQLSVPSPIIYVYDDNLIQPRTVLQTIELENDNWICKRVDLLQDYSWCEPHQDPILTHIQQTHSLLDIPVYFQRRAGASPPYTISPYVSSDIWEYVKPHFLPVNHPVRPKLDRMFSKTRVTQTPETFKEAGFKHYRPRRASRMMVSNHPLLTGYYVKAYSDLEPANVVDWKRLMRRIDGAHSIKHCILRHGYQKYFKVPKKWIYPLPPEPSPPNTPEYFRKNFILIAEDVRSVGHEKNEKMYRHDMTRELLDAIYTIFQEEGLADSVYAFNVPFCKDGKLAFIDTEIHHYWPVPFQKLTRYFSSEMRQYWQTLIQNNGPQ
jgi:hypothetical protein